MFGRCRAHMLKQVRARGSKRHARLPNNFLRHRMRRKPHRHRRESACTQVRDTFLLGQNHGHRARPIGLRQGISRIGNILRNIRQLSYFANMNNQRIKSRAFFNRKNLRQCRGQVGVTSKPINGFGRNRHHLAVCKQTSRIIDTSPRRELHSPKIKNRGTSPRLNS